MATAKKVIDEAGRVLGVVSPVAKGWIFIPHFQASPSRKVHPTPEAAVKGRLRVPYRMEAV